MGMQYWFLCWALIGVLTLCLILVYEAFQLKFRADKKGESAFHEVDSYRERRGVNEWSNVRTVTWIIGSVLFWPVPLYLWFRAAYTHGSLFGKVVHQQPTPSEPPPRIFLSKKDDVADVFRDLFS